MANTLNGFYTEKQTIERYARWLVFDITFGGPTGVLKLIDVPSNTVLLDAFANVYLAEAGATSSRISVRRTDGTTPVTLWTGTADNGGTINQDNGTLTPEVPLAATDEWYEADIAIVGTPAPAAQCHLALLAFRTSY